MNSETVIDDIYGRTQCCMNTQGPLYSATDGRPHKLARRRCRIQSVGAKNSHNILIKRVYYINCSI